MKIVCMSDSHNQHEFISVPEGDILIHSGDALGRGTLYETIRFNEWLGTLPHKHKIFVPGNHDEVFEVDPETAISALFNATVLIDKEINIEGLKIYGSPWTKTFRDWFFMKSEAELEKTWAEIPDGLDILITHGPPYGILDWNSRGDYCGSMALNKIAFTKRPKVHVFGHIHEAAGQKEYDNILFVNAAVLNHWYNLGHPPQVIRL